MPFPGALTAHPSAPTPLRERGADDLVGRCPGGLRPDDREPVLIAHRGASGYRPEHTLAAYELAARMGADYLGVDLVGTRDGHLVARHECELSGSTDIATRAEEFGGRRIEAFGSYLVRGWFTTALDLDQVRALRAVERYPQLRDRNVAYNGLLEVPTLEEVLALRRRLAVQLRRPLGLMLSPRHPDFHREQGIDLIGLLLERLRAEGLTGPSSPVVVVAEDLQILRRVRELGADNPLHLRVLVGEQDEALRRLDRTAELVSGLQPDKQLVRPRRFDGRLGHPTGLVRDAHRHGLVVHPWTFRAENFFLPETHRVGPDPSRPGRAADEIRAYLAVGVDGFGTDHTDRGVLARREAPAS